MQGRQGSLTSAAAVLVAACALAVGLFSASSASAFSPTDPMAGSEQPLQIMRVPEALDITGRAPVTVPVLIPDTGFDTDHPDLASRMLHPPSAGSDLIGNDCNPPNNNPDDDPNHPPGCSDHGTLVAGILGAAWNNGVGGAGVAPNALFVPMRTCWDNDQCFEFIQADAFNQAIDADGVRVVSMSWLTGNPPENDFKQAIASHTNTLFVAIPSGNGGATNADPDAENRPPCSFNLPNILCVTTSAPDDGLSCGDFGATLVDVAVPTENSVTTTNGGGFTGTGCATSFAAPAAAGVATILFGLFPQATPAEVRAAIIQGARPAAAWQGKSVSGGIIDAAGAVTALAGGNIVVPSLGLDLSAKRRQEATGLKITATCSEACDVTLHASGTAGGDDFGSKRVTESLDAGDPTTVKVKYTRRTRRRIDGERGRVTVTGHATSADGKASDSAHVRLTK